VTLWSKEAAARGPEQIKTGFLGDVFHSFGVFKKTSEVYFSYI